jgi:hypothetical protein
LFPRRRGPSQRTGHTIGATSARRR